MRKKIQTTLPEGGPRRTRLAGFSLLLLLLPLPNCLSAPKPSRLSPVDIPFAAVRDAGRTLDDVMEIMEADTVRKMLPDFESASGDSPVQLIRKGIFWHEVALNFGFGDNATLKGYAKKSYEILTELQSSGSVPRGYLPFVSAYRASALALWAGETSSLSRLSEAFQLFEDSVAQYSKVSYAPLFMRGSVAENLPRMFGKVEVAHGDFSALLQRASAEPAYLTPKILSLTLWAWANNRHRFGPKTPEMRAKILEACNRAISLDPQNRAGRSRAKKLKAELGESPG